MFDHIVSLPAQRTRHPKIHHHISVFAVIAGVIGTVIAVNLNLPTFRTTKISEAQEPQLSLRLLVDRESRSIVGPLTLEPILTIEAQVRTEASQLKLVQLYLDGVYDPAAIEGVTLFIDGAQAGLPVLPDGTGILRYPLDTVTLMPGMHRIEARITTKSVANSAVFQATVDPLRSFIVDRGGVRLALPYRASLIDVVSQGTIGAFTPTVIRGANPQAYVYAKAEDFRLEAMRLTSDSDLTGTRVDLFTGTSFLTAAQFVGDELEFDLSGTVLRVLRDQNRIFSFLMTPPPGAVAKLRLSEITATGLTSQRVITSQPALELLSD